MYSWVPVKTIPMAPGAIMCLNTFNHLGFYHLRFRHRLLIPQAAHIIPDVYSARTLALRTHFLQIRIIKNPGVFRSGVFWKF